MLPFPKFVRAEPQRYAAMVCIWADFERGYERPFIALRAAGN